MLSTRLEEAREASRVAEEHLVEARRPQRRSIGVTIGGLITAIGGDIILVVTEHPVVGGITLGVGLVTGVGGIAKFQRDTDSARPAVQQRNDTRRYVEEVLADPQFDIPFNQEENRSVESGLTA